MNTPDLTTYRAVHRALRAGAADLAHAAPRLADADRSARKAFVRYWTGYSGEVLGHHTIEDDFFFPALVERVPVAAGLIERTDADHHHLDELMLRLTTATSRLAEGTVDPALPALTAELADHMDAHLSFEDADILPLFERHFSAEEYDRMDEEAVKSLGVSRQAAFSVPFVVAALDDEGRARTMAMAPLPLRVLYRLTRRSHARLVQRAFGSTHPVTEEVAA